MSTSHTSFYRRMLGLAAGLALAVTLPAQNEKQERNYSPSDATSEALPKYKEAMEAKPPNYATALAVLNAAQAKAAPDSYDTAYILQLKLQVFLQQGEFAKAIEPMEKSLALSESKSPTYFDERVTRELYFFLVQLYFQEAAQTKNTTLAASYFDKAEKAMEHWLKITTPDKITSETQLIYAQLLFSKAMLNATNPDKELLKRSIDQVDIGLKLAIRPKDTFYVLKLVALNQLDRYEESSELLETLVKLKPDTATYWQQLAATYLSIAAKYEEGKQPQQAREFSIRSVVSIERAQANGFMNTPKDNYNLVGIYFNIAQFEKAAELLSAGLKSGAIENDPKNWELLALCWQQLQRPMKAIDALKEGTKAFPKSGQLEFQIAQGYTAMDKPEESLKHIQIAITKGNLTKPYQAYLSLAYTAYSLQKYEVALDAAKKAAEYPEGAKDGQNMADALTALLKDREAKKNKS